ncbi:type I polyketide synthase [Variovorax sp. J22R133]|uniref:type I polyketide synthase n=1 Tax=Variovorax brevis TaxID=3053503 RepID=UPI00257732F3|nr:type I polyketide synthase [Variovorax sp. J22R133]MDM0116495.1 type I polyketide synthase [Variovorax sp. J22R133]
MDTPLFSTARAPASIIETLRAWQERTPERIALTVLREGEEVESRVSFAQLYDASMRMAHALREVLPIGARVVLLLPTGLDFACAFYGNLAAGMVAIPALHPQQPRKIGQWRKLAAIVDSSGATLIIAPARSAALLEGMQASDGLFGHCRIATCEALLQQAGDAMQAASPWPLPRAGDLAFLQYTSGSTGSPKGVMITHANIIDNQQVIAAAMGHHSGSHLMSWLPLYHDMGLSALLQLATTGGTLVLMSPAAFIQKPLRWMKVISDYRINTSGAPDFAYHLAAAALRSPEAGEAGLDLSCWALAFCGAEPIRRSTVDAFLAAGAPFGLAPGAFFPCYGLAEATLQVSGVQRGEGVRHLQVSGTALTRGVIEPAQPDANDLKELVCCGRAPHGHTLCIVDDTGAPVADRQVGEIWVRSPSVGAGYYNDPVATAAAFGARLAGETETGYLRTGDLGALVDGELYVTGRAKDMLIIHGRNLYPQDLEECVQDAVPELRRGAGAAFATLVDDAERLVLVQEIGRAQRRSMDTGAVLRRMVGAIADDIGLTPHRVVLVEPATIEMTSSGKISRALTRRAYLEGTLRTVAVWTENGCPTATPDQAGTTENPCVSIADSEPAFLRRHFEQEIAQAAAAMLNIEAARVPRHAPWTEMGFDSIRAPQLASLIERKTGLKVETTAFWECANVEALALYLAEMKAAAGAQTPQPPASPQLHPAATAACARIDTADDARTHSPSDAAAREIEALRKDLQCARDAANEPIAIVGIGCRLPGGADSSERLWELLAAGINAVTQVPPERWSDALYDPRPGRADTSYSRHGAFIDGVDLFDAAFFGVSGREARRMDPQQRLLLECSWRAIEEAGFSRESIKASRTGVFVGSSLDDYARLSEQLPAELHSYAQTSLGTGRPLAAGRIAYLFGLHGPALQLDTACSSSLVTTHLACQSLRNRECDLALSGGVNLMLSPEMTIALCELQALSPDGRCKTFDAGANGYVRGEGAGVVALMRLSDALAQDRPIRALIRGSAVNHDGKSNGMTAPNGRAQRDVIRAALQRAGVAPSEVDYVEAHGTGTALGDPVELRALHDVYCHDTGRAGPLHVGSIKTNIGHLEAAASVASLIKVVCALQKAELPAHLHFETPTPHVDWQNNGIRVTDRHMPWPASNAGRRVAAISAFGMSGTNAHLIVEAWRGGDGDGDTRARASDGTDVRAQIVPVSGHSPDVLTRSLRELDEHLLREPNTPLGDLAHSLRVARDTHACRRAFVVRDTAALCVELARSGAAPIAHDATPSTAPRLAFLFSGQGSQHIAMGRRLYQNLGVFRQHIDACDEQFKALSEHLLIDVLWGSNPTLVHNTQYTQPALFALELALARLWIDWGIAPDALMGHSVGEYAAACVAGVFSMEDGLRLVAARGRLMQLRTPAGAMAAVLAPAADITPRLQAWQGRIALAADNGPQSVVVSGDPQSMATWVAQLKQEGVQTRPLSVARAFHSPLMDAMLEPFRQVAASVRFQPPRLPLVSNLTGRFETERFCDPGYWVDHVRQGVQFRQGMQCLLDNDIGCFLEIGPGKTLANLARSCAGASQGARAGRFVHSFDEQHDEHEQLLLALATMYGDGHAVDWGAFERSLVAPHPPRRTRLPPYPLDMASYWIGPRLPAQGGTPLGSAQQARTPVDRRPLGRELNLPGTAGQGFEQSLSLRQQPILRGHVVQGQAIFPAAGYIAMALDGARRGALDHPLALHDFSFEQPLRLDEDTCASVSTWLHAGAGGARRLEIFSQRGGQDRDGWTLHASAQIGPPKRTPSAVPSLQKLRAECTDRLDTDALYQQLAQVGLHYGAAFRALGEVARHGDWAIGRVRRMAESAAAGHFADMALLDACLQLVAAALPPQPDERLYLPVGLESLRGEALGEQDCLWCAVRVVATAPLIRADLWIYDEDERCLLELENLQLTAADPVRVGAQMVEPSVHRMGWNTLAPIDASDAMPIDTEICLLGADKALARAMHAAAEGLGQGMTQLPSPESVHTDELTRSLARLALASDKPLVLLYAWNAVAGAPHDGAGELRIVNAEYQRFAHFWRTLQGIEWGARRLRVALLTRAAHSVVAGDRTPMPCQAAAWGLARSLMHEAGAVDVSVIDLGQVDAAHCTGALRAIGPAAHALERQFAVRGDTIHVPRVKPHALAAPTGAKLAPGTYLVTGGRGALGTTLVEWLIAKGANRIVSASRELPDDAQRLRLGVRAEAVGATLLFRQIDVADAQEVRGLIDEIEWDARRPLKGVFHTAGVLDDGLLHAQTGAGVLEVLRPKVAGGLNLHRATTALALDHFVLFSSVVSCIGSPGQCAYGAANAWLDALAASRRAMGLPAQSIGWGLWGGSGMASRRDAQHKRRSDAVGLFDMAPADAMHALERLLVHGSGHELVWSVDVGLLSKGSPGPGLRALLQEVASAQAPSGEAASPGTGTWAASLRGLSPVRMRQALTHRLVDELATTLQIAAASLSPKTALIELGMDSLDAAEFRNAIRRELQVDIPFGRLLDGATLDDIVATVAEKLARDAQEDAAPDAASQGTHLDANLEQGQI